MKYYQQILLREGETHQILFAGRIYKIDTSYDPDLKQMNNDNIKLLSDLENKSAKIGLDIVSISTAEDYVDPLMKFFKKRGKKY